MYITNYTNEDSIKKLTDINVILESWDMFYKNFSCKPDEKEFPKYNRGDIINEDKSVKWNREEVERRINVRAEEVKQLQTLRNKLDNLYERTIIKALAKKYKISIKEVGIIWAKAYEDGHSFGVTFVYDIFSELADMYEELRKAANENTSDDKTCVLSKDEADTFNAYLDCRK